MTKSMLQLSLSVSILVMTLIGCSNTVSSNTVSVTFIRHGHGQHQELYELGKREEGDAIRDPKLTAKGKEQAQELGQTLAKEHFDLAVTSPMTRAIETASFVFEGRSIPIIVLPEVAESCDSPSCTGTEVDQLIHQFRNVDFSRVAGPLEKTLLDEPEGALEKRIFLFKAWLRTQSGKTIAVVSHSGFLKSLLGIDFENCGKVRRVFHPNGEFVQE